MQLDSALGGTYATPVEVTVHLRDGRSATRRVEQMLGDPALPLDAAQRREKLERCVGFARRPLSPERVDRLVADVRRLELLPDVGATVEL